MQMRVRVVLRSEMPNVHESCTEAHLPTVKSRAHVPYCLRNTARAYRILTQHGSTNASAVLLLRTFREQCVWEEVRTRLRQFSRDHHGRWRAQLREWLITPGRGEGV